MPRNRTESTINKLNALTWDDLNEWVGSRSVGRGRSYQKNKRVHDLAQLPDGGIIACVQGERRYVTSVNVERGRLNGTCTCLIGGQCKHAGLSRQQSIIIAP